MSRPFLLSVALVAITGSVVACSASPAAPTTDTGRPVTGGTLQVGLPVDPTCLDPQQTNQLTTMDMSRSLVDSLTDQDPRTGAIVPWLASSFSVANGERQFTFALRAGPTFSDGTPVDAAAVKATFDRLATMPAIGPAAYFAGYAGTTVTDAHHVTVDFANPNTQFLQATSTVGFGILSVATASRSLPDRCRGDFVGSGPFVLDHYTSDQEVVLRRRAGYAWPSSIASNKGAAYLSSVRFLFVPEDGARTGALSSGQIQVGENIQPSDQGQFLDNGFHLLARSLPGLVPPLSLNQAGILGDERVRAALLIAINRRELVDTMLSPQYKPATGPLSSTTPFYTNVGAKLGYDPQRAAQLLTSAGWIPGANGIRAKNGRPLSLDWLIPSPMPVVDEYVQQQLQKIGIGVKLDIVPAARYVEQQQAGNFDISAVSVARADPDVLRVVFASKGANIWHLPPSPLDTYLDQEVSATTAPARQAAVTNAVNWIVDHADTVPLYESAQVHGVANQVQNLNLDASLRLNLHDAWLD